MLPHTISRAVAAFIIGAAFWAPAADADDPTYELTIRDHRFQPDTLSVPTNTRVKLLIHNADATPEEFESEELNREKIVPPKGKIVVFIGPLEAGTYPFVGEFHEDSAKGRIVAK